MFSLPFYVYLILAVVGAALLVAARYIAPSQEDGAPLGGNVYTSIYFPALMTSVGVTLMVCAVVFGFPSMAGAVQSALNFLI